MASFRDVTDDALVDVDSETFGTGGGGYLGGILGEICAVVSSVGNGNDGKAGIGGGKVGIGGGCVGIGGGKEGIGGGRLLGGTGVGAVETLLLSFELDKDVLLGLEAIGSNMTFE